MSLMLILYVIVLSVFCYVFHMLYTKKTRYIYEKYLMYGMVIFLIWMSVYTSLFLFDFDSILDLYRVRISYAIWSFTLYIMLWFFYFYGLFDTKKLKKISWIHPTVAVIWVLLFIWIVCTDFFIESVSYDNNTGESFEVFWPWYDILGLSHLVDLVVVIWVIIYKFHVLKWIYKIRFMYIALGYLIMIFLQIFFLSILPIWDIWLFQKEQILFFLPFLFWLLYAMYRYRFRKIWFGVWRIMIFIFSLLLSVFFILGFKEIFWLIDSSFFSFWKFTSIISVWDLIVGNIVFYFIHSYFQNQFQFYYNSSFYLQKRIYTLQSKIPFLQDSKQLINFLQEQFRDKLNIKWTAIYYKRELKKYSEISKYLQQDQVNWILLNDDVFLEENKHKFNTKKLKKQLDNNIGLYIPMYRNKWELEWILAIGRKPFNDYYKSYEIEILEDFASFLTGHLTYMNIYSKIHDLNLTLDKKVDEKTIEYNNLINRQKDFIAYVGHEIRNPVTNTIFLCYDLQERINDAVDEKKIPSDFREDIDILSSELKKVSELSKNIFTSEKITLGKTKLYKTHIKLYDFILSEVSVLSMKHSQVHFDTQLKDVWMVSIDEVQFRQVITNLLGNALKFIPKHGAKISVALWVFDDRIQIVIEDNGEWFKDVDNANVFDKYRTWDHESSWLGMWLYLCKKIVELHGWSIESSISKKLWWACFTIIL